MKFPGFESPRENWSRLPHELINHLHLMTSEAEVKVVLYTLRHTWGFGDDQKRITIDEFCRGRKRKDGSRFDNGTGLSENAIRAGIENAVKHGFIEVSEDATDKARIKRYYQLATPDTSELEVQSLNPWPSEVEPLDSTSEPRSEKETIRKKLKKEPPVSISHSGEKTTPGPLTTKLLKLCKLDYDLMTKTQHERFSEVLKLLIQAGATAERLGYFEKYWRNDWRGKDGSPPPLPIILELWPQFVQWEIEHIKNGRVIHKLVDRNDTDLVAGVDFYIRPDGAKVYRCS